VSKQVTLSFSDALKKLQKSLEGLTPALEQEVNQAVKDVAHAAYASIVAKAQASLGSRRQDYLKALQFEDLGDNSYVITLDGKLASLLEDGSGPYDLRPGMLASKKLVEVGSRAGEPWVQKAKDGHKFAHVPMQIRPHSKVASSTSNLADAIKATIVKNSQGLDQKLTSIFRNADGSAVDGKVASIKRGKGNPLSGLVKYQKVGKTSEGKETVQSIYIRYRTVSERGKAWIHPGFDGLNAFPDAEAEVVKQLDAIVKTLIK
jgi:hypothetical protein